MFKTSNKLDCLLNKHCINDLMNCMDGVYDGTCTTGYDNDGSTGLEIFENGVTLGAQANVIGLGRGSSPIFIYTDEYTALFFIGEEEQVIAKARKAIKELEE